MRCAEPTHTRQAPTLALEDPTRTERARIVLHGAVQGVGFRPFTYRLATELGLHGWVTNTSQGVFIEVEGERAQLEQFLLRVERGKPRGPFIQSLETFIPDPVGYVGFEMRKRRRRARRPRW